MTMSQQPGKAFPDLYREQISHKINRTIQQFSRFGVSDIEVFESPPAHFRMRAEFKIWHQEGVARYAMYRPGEYKQPILINEFSIGSGRINELMPGVLSAINQEPAFRQKLFQVEFLTTLTGDALITLIYHKSLDDQWAASAAQLEKLLGAKIIGRSRKQKIVVSMDYVDEEFSVNGENYCYRQVETGFTQPNARVCEKMLTWAQAVSSGIGNDMLELYCGNGNFTLPLSKNFEKVLATEVSKTSVNSALYNIAANRCTNIAVARMSSEEFTQALNGEREFRRLQDIDLQSYRFSTMFVDPPRAGLDNETVKLAARFDNIIYISCNPDTLYNNLEMLSNTHRIERFALFDQFPYTDHRECGVLLRKSE